MKKVFIFCNETKRKRQLTGLLKALFPDCEIHINPSTPEKVTQERYRKESSLSEAHSR